MPEVAALPTITNVLIVEDEAIVALELSQILRGEGYSVVGTAASAAAALELGSLIAVDIVLMDIRIQGDMDGIQTAEEFRLRHGVPVVFITSHADDSTLRRAKLTQPFGFIIKPFTPADITVGIEVALNRHRLEMQGKQREARFSKILSSMADSVIATDFDGAVRFMNPAAELLTGVTFEKGGSTPLSSVISLSMPDSGSTSEDLLSLTMSHATSRTDLILKSATEPGRKISLRSSALESGPDGQREGTVLVLRELVP